MNCQSWEVTLDALSESVGWVAHLAIKHHLAEVIIAWQGRVVLTAVVTIRHV
jgi:hypothetical protein